jgi:release factor glutamine methyltransferase
MNLREWLDRGEAILADGPHADRARRDAETLLLHQIGKNKAWLIVHFDEEFAGCSAISYASLLERRRRGEPIQYITGETEFYGLPFRVTPDVLIPRPETEHLVEKAIELARQSGMLSAPSEPREQASGYREIEPPKGEMTNPAPPLSIVDVGTGSGAIAIALATQLPDATITATDISGAALAIARDNAARNQVLDRIRFLEGDLLAPVAGEQFEIIVSNPPYVPYTDRASIAVEVREYEPALALFTGPNSKDGLDIYRRLIPSGFGNLVPGGFLLVEIELLKVSGFESIEFIADLQGIPRVACAHRGDCSDPKS